MTKNIFELTQQEKDILGINDDSKPDFRKRFIELFNYGKKLGKDRLSIYELTAGYYNLYCKNNSDEKIYNVNKLGARLRYYFTIFDYKYNQTYEEAVKEAREYTKANYLYRDGKGLYVLVER